MSVSVDAGDDWSGVQEVTARLYKVESGAPYSAATATLTLASGSPGSGTWNGVFVVPASAAWGTYGVLLSVQDNAQRWSTYRVSTIPWAGAIMGAVGTYEPAPAATTVDVINH